MIIDGEDWGDPVNRIMTTVFDQDQKAFVLLFKEIYANGKEWNFSSAVFLPGQDYHRDAHYMGFCKTFNFEKLK